MPYPNEHSARLQEPNKFNQDTFRRVDDGTIYGKIKVPQTAAVIWGKLKGRDKPADNPIPQAIRFPTRNWTAEEARAWLKKNNVKYIRFEPASGGKKTEAEDVRPEMAKARIQSVLAELKAEYWVMEDHHLEQLFFEIASQQTAPPADVEIAVKENPMRIDGASAYVPIKGVLMRKLPAAFAWWGIEGTSYETIAGQISQAMADRNIREIILEVDSPGGTVPGVAETAEIIREARKKKTVRAVIDDLGASGAYWLASQADHIEIVKNGMAGSIGVFSVYLDRSAMAEKLGIKVIVIKSGEHKGMGVPGAQITENQIAAVQEIIDGIAGNFIADVAAGRRQKKEQVAEWATGKLWLADKAAAIGIIDSVKNKSRKSNLKGKVMEEMTDQQIDAQIAANEAKAAEQIEKARAEASGDTLEKERKRIAAINEKFGDDLQFANKAIIGGWSIEKANDEFVTVLRGRLKEKENQGSDGAPPLISESTDVGSSGDFIAEAEQMAEEKKISKTKAMQQLARRKPALHKAFLEKCKTEGHQMYAEAV